MEPRPHNIYKLNIYDAYQKNSDNEGAGGIIRNYEGQWIDSFSYHTMASSPIQAEIIALLKVLELVFTKNNFVYRGNR